MADDEKPKVTLVMNSNASSLRMLMPDASSAVIKDPIETAPIVDGPHGRAWLCDIAAGRRIMNCPPERDATLDHWVVEAPWAHPVWHSYSVLLLHLRDIPGMETKFYIPQATHEMHVYALDPEKDRAGMIHTGIQKSRWLQPCNFAAQFIEITDELARERVRKSVQMICDGTLSPDVDFQQMWVDLYNHSMIKREFRR